MKNDRNYYRMLDNDSLINEGRDSMDELAIVLADRLDELQVAQEQLEALKNEVVELNARCDLWKAEAAMLQAQLEAK